MRETVREIQRQRVSESDTVRERERDSERGIERERVSVRKRD